MFDCGSLYLLGYACWMKSPRRYPHYTRLLPGGSLFLGPVGGQQSGDRVPHSLTILQTRVTVVQKIDKDDFRDGLHL